MIKYKIDVLSELKKKGFTTYVIRNNNYLSQAILTKIRKGEPLPISALESICIMLQKQPSEIIEVQMSHEEKERYFPEK